MTEHYGEYRRAQLWCRPCKRAAQAEWYRANKERAKQYNIGYRKRNKVAVAKYRAAYYVAHRDKLIAYARKYRQSSKQQRSLET